jgi:hypothetical protein
MVDSQSQALNLQHGDQVIRSLLEEWIAKQAQGRKTKDQTDRKPCPYLDDDTSWRRSYLSRSCLPGGFHRISKRYFTSVFD